MGYLLGVDIGTTTCKLAIFDAEGKLIKYLESEAYQIIRPRRGWAEQDPREWWKALKSLLKKVKDLSKDIDAISVSSMEEGVVPVDKEGRPLYSCMIWQDMRTKPQAEWVMKNVGFIKVLEITGLPPAYVWSAEKVLWIKENLRDIFDKTYKFLQPKDYINYLLTGEFTTDWSIAGHTQLFDIRRRRWSEELMEAHGIPIDKWPEVYPSSVVIGEISGKVAEETGLRKGIPVVAGGGDQEVFTLGCGAIEEGMTCLSAGTSNVLNVVLSRVICDPRLTVFCHPMDDLWIAETYPSQIGEALRWIRDNFWRAEIEDAYKDMDYEAEKSPPGANGLVFYPYFRGKYTYEVNEEAKATIINLTFSHTRGDLIRALMESSSYEVKELIDFMMRRWGLRIDRVIVGGGVAKSSIWRRIMASILSIPIVTLEVKDVTTLGDCILASVGAGHYRNLKVAVKRMVKIGGIEEPLKEWVDIYSKLYKNYRKIYRLLEKLYRRPFVETNFVLETISLYLKIRRFFRR